MSKPVDWALFYREKLNWSIIPILPGEKKPAIDSWRKYQKVHPTPDEIRSWWRKHPRANIAVITGEISNLVAVDIDEYKTPGTLEHVKEIAYKHAEDLTFQPWEGAAISKTARGGIHWLFGYVEGLKSRKVLPSVDIKTNGGYVVLPPSKIGEKGSLIYTWIKPPYDPKDKRIRILTKLPEVYQSLWSKDRPFSPTDDPTENEGSPDILVRFEEGYRDESLFHIANCLVKGGMHPENVSEVIHQLGAHCDPPFSDGEIEAKVRSALERKDQVDSGRLQGLTVDFLEYLKETPGVFDVGRLDVDLGLKTKAEKKARRQMLWRLHKQGIIEPLKGKGLWRKVDDDLEVIDYKKVDLSRLYVDFVLPFGEHDLVHILPKSVIVYTGAPEAGKTSTLLNIVKDNQDKFPINYFSSEMGPMEFNLRLNGFPDLRPDQWKFRAYERSEDFADVVVPNEVNIIDYLELHDNFYQVGLFIRKIWEKLTTGIAIIAIQKNPGTPNPLGGERAREKARLVINLESNYPGYDAIITKAKNWKSHNNPSGLSKHYNLRDGCIIEPWPDEWRREE